MGNDNHASYATIGFTVMIGVIAIIAVLIYLGGLRGRGDDILVETYYDNGVSGLAVGSPVNFRGVKIGEVREISFVGIKYEADKSDSQRIYVLMALKKSIFGVDQNGKCRGLLLEDIVKEAAKMGMRATVTASGITGMSRIECDFPKEEVAAPRKISWQPKHVYIPAGISLLDNFSDSATKVMNQINRMDISSAWSNIFSTVTAFANMSTTMDQLLNSRQPEIEKIITDLTETAAATKDLLHEVRSNPSLLLRDRVQTPLPETAR